MTDTAATRSGLIVAGFGRQFLVEDSDGERHVCRIKGRSLRPVCGDNVYWEELEEERVRGVITAIRERHNLLCRPTRRGREESIAANLHSLVIVSACRPHADPFLIDRYIAAAEHLRINSIVVYNKIDLEPDHIPQWFEDFRALGYPVVFTSATTGAGIDALKELCAEGINMLVGQSGVGKSSLLNAMIPGIDQLTGELSESGKFGRHTTTASYLYHLPDSTGSLIDSPGVRDFAPPPLDSQQVPGSYIEIHAAAQECRFNNCLHQDEPHCNVKLKVESGEIEQRRYASYLKLLDLMRRLKLEADPG